MARKRRMRAPPIYVSMLHVQSLLNLIIALRHKRYAEHIMRMNIARAMRACSARECVQAVHTFRANL